MTDNLIHASSTMTFEKLHQDTPCNCLSNDCFEDVQSHWGLKTNKELLRENDFRSKHEKGQIDQEKTYECDELCSLKGMSMSLVKNTTQDNKDAILEIYKQLFPSAPKYKPYLSIIKFKAGLGLIKYSPLADNPFHHDLYKCDTFEHSEVELIESISLSDNV